MNVGGGVAENKPTEEKRVPGTGELHGRNQRRMVEYWNRISYTVQLILACLVFMMPAEKRLHFYLRTGLFSAIFIVGTFCYNTIFRIPEITAVKVTIQMQEEQKCSSCFLTELQQLAGKGDSMAKFLNYEDRLEIESGLKEHMTFTELGEKLGRDRTTITKEIRNYSIEQDTGYGSYPHNTCKYRKACKRKKVCGTNDCRHPLVAVCKQCELICNRYCEHYEEEICTHRFKPPYVCNGCSEVKKCTLTKTVYDALGAQRRATDKISESRSGILATEGEIARLNEILVPLVKQGQSIHQIYLTHKDELMCSEKTLYNYVDGCLFDIRNIDLPRKVKYRPRY